MRSSARFRVMAILEGGLRYGKSAAASGSMSGTEDLAVVKKLAQIKLEN